MLYDHLGKRSLGGGYIRQMLPELEGGGRQEIVKQLHNWKSDGDLLVMGGSPLGLNMDAQVAQN